MALVSMGETTPHCFGAVVTSFNPPESFVENMKAISNQVVSLIIVDNGSDSIHEVKFRRLLRDCNNIKVIYNGQNFGVATALNTGVRELLKSPVKWIATFDHDTLITDNYFLKLVSTAKSYQFFNMVRLIAPSSGKYKGRLLESREEVVAITSGTLHRRDVFDEVGFFKESLFIDCIDHEFCFRLNKFGYKLLVVNSVQIKHQLGYPSNKKFLCFSYWTLNYTPMRCFYIYRNSVWLTRQYWRYSMSWFVRYWWYLLKNIIKILFSETNRKSKLQAILRGFFSGLTVNLL